MNDSLQSSSANPPAGPTRKRTVLQLLSIFMIGNFLWRASKPGYEWPTRFEQVVTISFDLLCVGRLIALKMQISRAMPSDRRIMLRLSFVIAATNQIFNVRYSYWLYSRR